MIVTHELNSLHTSKDVASEDIDVHKILAGINIWKRLDSSAYQRNYALCEFAANSYGEPYVGNLLVRFDED